MPPNNTNKKSITYADAGVNIDAGNEAVRRIAAACKNTHGPEVRSAKGGFGALYALSAGMNACEKPVLVSGADGVGTKLLIAKKHNHYGGVGQDCVAMCINDIACHGARPLFFLDYIACGKLEPDVVSCIVQSMVAACKECGCALIGGETAEMPGMYASDDYDLAGFVVGMVDERAILDGAHTTRGIQNKDALIGIASSGLHSNGFSLIRALYPDTSMAFEGQPLYHTLLHPTRLYSKAFGVLIDALNGAPGHNTETPRVRALAHITGGGIFENIGRIMPHGLRANVRTSAVPPQPVFQDIRARHEVEPRELWRTFNMGIGAAVVVAPDIADEAVRVLRTAGENAFVAGHIDRADDQTENVVMHE